MKLATRYSSANSCSSSSHTKWSGMKIWMKIDNFQKPPTDVQNWRKKGKKCEKENENVPLDGSTKTTRRTAVAKKQTGECCWSCSVHPRFTILLSLLPTFPSFFLSFFFPFVRCFVVFFSVHGVRIWVNFGSMRFYATNKFSLTLFFYLISTHLLLMRVY